MSDSHSGGYFPAELKFAGFDGVIIKGRSPKPVHLAIKDGKAELRDASHLWGKGVFETTDLIVKESGENPRHYADGPKVGCIGPAGENKVRFAAIAYDEHHFAGRGGTGAVMGSKNLKAISARGTKQAKALSINSDPAFLTMVREVIKKDIRENPDEEMLMKTGTPGIVALSQGAGLLPTRNFQAGTFAQADQINADALSDQILVRHTTTCYSCSIGCRNITKIKDGQYAGLEGEGPEYETLALCGSNMGIGDIRVILKFNEDCSNMGLDTISAGNVCAWAMELFERGILTKKDTGGLDLKFGNVEAAVALPQLIATRKSIGNVLAEGVAQASKQIGKSSERYAVHAKGLEYPGYDPRATFGMALAYATSERGADHNRAWPVGYDAFGKLDPFTPEGKAENRSNRSNPNECEMEHRNVRLPRCKPRPMRKAPKRSMRNQLHRGDHENHGEAYLDSGAAFQRERGLLQERRHNAASDVPRPPPRWQRERKSCHHSRLREDAHRLLPHLGLGRPRKAHGGRNSGTWVS